MSIKQDSKTIVRNSVAIPLTATATGLEVAAKVSDTGLSMLRGSPKFLGDVADIFGTFVSGAINHDTTPEQAERIYQDESPREFRRLVCVSHAASDDSSIC